MKKLFIMKKLVYLSFSLLLIFSACQKADTNVLLEADKEMKTGPDGKLSICHIAGKDKNVVIQISQNALAAHLAHGDYVLDVDGDGFTADGACSGTMNDCDDNDALVNPGAAEICGDGKDNNCNGTVDENCPMNFEIFNIRNNSGSILAPWETDIILNENAAGDGFTFGTPRGGQKVGYGTNFFDGVKLNTIETVNWNWLSVPANSGIVPYLNIWVTDGLGNYAVIASENNYKGTDFGTRTEWKVFEFGVSSSNLDWLFDSGTGAKSATQYLTHNGINATLSELSDRIVIGDPGVYPSPNVGTGAPRGGYGFNLIWGDTQSNFIAPNGLQIGGLTVTASGVTHAATN